MDRIMTNAEANLILLQSVIPADEKPAKHIVEAILC